MSRLSYKTLFIILLFLLIPIVFLLRINQKNKNIYAAWWNDSWMYRQSINISSHTSAESNVYITTTINIGTTNKAQADAGDFRFLDLSGNLLPYYIVSGAGTTAITFHIQLDSFPIGAQSIYAYYGNPSVSNGFSASDFSTAASNYTIGSLGTEETGGAPIAWWKFDEGVGTTAFDSSSNHANGFISNAIWADETSCISGKCLYFNGTSAGINLGSVPPLRAPYTISFWMKPQKLSSSQSILSLRGSNSYPYFLIPANNRLLTYAGPEKYRYGAKTFSSSDLNQWFYVTMTVTDSASLTNWKVYLNGQDNTSTPGSNTGNYYEPGSPGYIGKNASAEYFQGFLDDIKIYPYARTAAQIKQDYTTGLSGQSSSKGTNTSFGSSSLKSLSDGLVGYWKFDEGVGTTSADSSGNSNTATFGAGTSAPSWGSGKYGIGTSFNTGQFIDSGTASSLNITTENFSVSVWIKGNNSATSENIIVKSIFTGQHPGYGIILRSTQPYIKFWVFDTSLKDTGGTTPDIRDGKFHHLLGVRNSTSLQLYLDGIKILDNPLSTGNIGTSSPLIFGKDPANTNYLTSLLDEVRIYNRALSPDEVKQLYNYDPNATAENHKPIAWYKFDEGQGTVANNSGLQGATMNGSLKNSPTWTNQAKTNKGLILDGLNDYVQIPVNTSIKYTGDDFTLSVWFKPDSSDSDTGQILARPWNGMGVYNYWFSTPGGSNPTPSFLLGGDTNYTLSFNKAITSNEWHQLSATINSNKEVKLYIDGTLTNSGTHSITTWIPSSYGDENLNLALGTLYPYGDPWAGATNYSVKGSIDDIKIYNYALSADEIKSDYNQSSSAVFGVTNLTVGNTSNSTLYCIPGSTDYCASPVAEWKFDESIGTTAYDTSGNNNNGIFGAGSSAPTWTTGKIGKAAKLDGNDYLKYPNSLLNGKTSMSASAWFKTSDTNGGIVADYNTSSAYTYKIIVKNNYLSACVGTGYPDSTCNSSTNQITSSTIVNDNKWHQAYLIYNGSLVTLYLDGINIGTTEKSGTIPSTGGNSAFIGAQGYDTGSGLMVQESGLLTGYIDQVQLFNYARTPAQIAWDYNQGAPIGWWKFDECQGSIAHDSSGIGNTGAISIGASGTQNTLGTCTVGTSAAWTNGATGKLNSSLNFDGIDDIVTISNHSSYQFGINDFSISTWIKPSEDLANYDVIFSKSSSLNHNNYVNALFSAYGELRWYFDDSTETLWNHYVTFGANANFTNKWSHILMVRQGTSIKGYLNGKLVSTSSLPSNYNLSNTYSVDLGKEGSIGTYYPGQIDDVRIYNYALTSDQIKQIYNGGSVTFN